MALNTITNISHSITTLALRKIQLPYDYDHDGPPPFLNVLLTVKPVHKGHSMEPENVAIMSSCPIYTGLTIVRNGIIHP
jgi:hypothetical protein